METMTAQPIEQAAIDAGTDIPEIVAPAARRKLGALRSLGPFLKRYRWRLLIALVMLLVSSGAFLSVPLAFRGLIDHGFVAGRSDEHTSELPSLLRISYAVFCLKKQNNVQRNTQRRA